MYCGKCEAKVENSIAYTNSSGDENKINGKEPIKIKFSYFIISIIILFLLPTCKVFFLKLK